MAHLVEPREDERIHRTWVSGDRAVVRAFVQPVMRFAQVEAAGGIVLLVAAVVALIWANGPFGDTYETFWETPFVLEIGSFHLEESLKHVVNDALMAIFFFVVGMEIKRELVVGELRGIKHAALPAVAALGGMLVPALIYLAFVGGPGADGGSGWGIPMATDIAFSVGVISLLGRRVPVGAKLFLLALAIADDIGAILVIAVFYTTGLSMGWLLAAVAGLAVVYVAGRVAVRSLLFYVVAGTAVWFCVLESGVHATIAGVVLGLMTPVGAYYSDKQFRAHARTVLARFQVNAAAPNARERIDNDALELAAIARESVSPLDRLERHLVPWASFVIVPLFALANAGVDFSGVNIASAVTSPVALGVSVGLVVGKLVGISAATLLAVRLGVGVLPSGTGSRQVIGLAAVAGVGFTVSLFIAELAFSAPELTINAKTGIFVGSAIAGVLGYLLLRTAPTTTGPLTGANPRIGANPTTAPEDEHTPPTG